jgi:hypothetical protein
MAHDWPGNVRELRNEVERALALSPAGEPPMIDWRGTAAPAPVRSNSSSSQPGIQRNRTRQTVRDAKAAAMEEFEPSLPDDEPGYVEPAASAGTADADATAEAPPARDVREAAEAASVDEWDPFGNECGAEAKQGDAEEDLPWLEGIDQAAAGSTTGGWTPPAQDEGLDFLREIEESTRTPASPSSGDLGADDLAFLEELDRAISGGGQRPAPPAAPAQADAGGLGLVGGSGDGPDEPADGTEDQPKRGEALLCKECGAINEPQAWYCEICGSEL